MQATDRELWLVNFYRNSELHGALLMGKLARSYTEADLLLNLTRHCATEARHAALLSEAIVALGGGFDPQTGTIQERYAAAGGVPIELVDLLVLTEVLEQCVLKTYRAHLDRGDVHPHVRETLSTILREELEHSGQEGWVEKKLASLPADAVAAAEAKWRAIDTGVAGDLERLVQERFPETEVVT